MIESIVDTMITQVQSVCSSQSLNQIYKLNHLKNNIIQKMKVIDCLNQAYQEKVEFSFLKTFTNIINDLSQQLKNAVQAYQNIDQQIQKDPKCILLTRQANFYKQEKQLMNLTYLQELQKLKQLKIQNQLLKNKRNQLKRKSLQSQQKFVKFNNKNKSLSVKLTQLTQIQTIHKKLTQSTNHCISKKKTNNLIKQKNFFENSSNQSKIQPKNLSTVETKLNFKNY